MAPFVFLNDRTSSTVCFPGLEKRKATWCAQCVSVVGRIHISTLSEWPKTCLKIWCQGDSKIKNKSFNDFKKNYPPMFLILLEKSEVFGSHSTSKKTFISHFSWLTSNLQVRCKLWLLYIQYQSIAIQNFPQLTYYILYSHLI